MATVGLLPSPITTKAPLLTINSSGQAVPQNQGANPTALNFNYSGGKINPNNPIVGQQAKSPVQNIAAPKTTLSPAQTATPSLNAYKYADSPTVYGNYNGNPNYAFTSGDEFLKAGGDWNKIITKSGSATPTQPTPQPTYIPPPTVITTDTPPPITPQPTPPTTTGAPGTTVVNGGNTGVNQGGIIGGLINNAQNNPLYQKYQDIYTGLAGQIGNLGQDLAKQLGDVNSQGDMPLAMGRAGVLQQVFAGRQAALAGQEQAAQQAAQNALTAQGATTTGLNNAGNLNQPVQVPYSNQFVNPVTGQSVGGGSVGQLPSTALSFINDLAQQVKDGKMTRADAESRISVYSQPGLQALNSALGSDFNTNASNASATTTGIGQQIQAAIGPANQALDALQIAFSSLPGIQQSNVPFLNELTQNAAMLTGLGRQQASNFQGALQEARSRIDAALVGSIGVNAAAAQANALLPDNMVPSEIPGKIAAAKMYLQNQLAGYTQSGQQNGSTSTSSNSSTVNLPDLTIQ